MASLMGSSARLLVQGPSTRHRHSPISKPLLISVLRFSFSSYIIRRSRSLLSLRRLPLHRQTRPSVLPRRHPPSQTHRLPHRRRLLPLLRDRTLYSRHRAELCIVGRSGPLENLTGLERDLVELERERGGVAELSRFDLSAYPSLDDSPLARTRFNDVLFLPSRFYSSGQVRNQLLIRIDRERSSRHPAGSVVLWEVSQLLVRLEELLTMIWVSPSLRNWVSIFSSSLSGRSRADPSFFAFYFSSLDGGRSVR